MAEYRNKDACRSESAFDRKEKSWFLKKKSATQNQPTQKNPPKSSSETTTTKLKKNLTFFLWFEAFLSLCLSSGKHCCFYREVLEQFGLCRERCSWFPKTYLPRYSARYWIMIFPFLLGYEYCHFSAPPLCKRGGSFLAAGGSVWAYAAWLLQHKSCWYAMGTFLKWHDKNNQINWCYFYWNKYMGRCICAC